jgi:hypothetical protein
MTDEEVRKAWRSMDLLLDFTCECLDEDESALGENEHIQDCSEAEAEAALNALVTDHDRARASEQALLADNAALLKAGNDLAEGPLWSEPSEGEAAAIAVLKQPHPGAALLRRMEEQEKHIARLTEALDAIRDARPFHGQTTPEAIAKAVLLVD